MSNDSAERLCLFESLDFLNFAGPSELVLLRMEPNADTNAS